MKKISLLFIILVIIAGIMSCKKDYTCTCDYPNNPQANATTYYNKVAKSIAVTDCDMRNETAQSTGGTCVLQ